VHYISLNGICVEGPFCVITSSSWSFLGMSKSDKSCSSAAAAVVVVMVMVMVMVASDTESS